MFTAKVYKIFIASASGAMKEERVAQDIVAKWNCQNGEGCGVVFMQVPLNDSPDVCVFVIDNYVDAKNGVCYRYRGECRIVFLDVSRFAEYDEQ